MFAGPVYFYGLPAQLKAIIDNLYSLATHKADEIAGKKCALISVCGDPALDYSLIVNPYKATYQLLRWEPVGEVLLKGLMDIGDVEKTDGIHQVVELAGKF